MVSTAKLREFNAPPEINSDKGRFQLDKKAKLHRLAVKRMAEERDLKIIITADDSETGVGKTTLAAWLALNWNYIFSDEQWTPEEYATFNPPEYFEIVTDVPPGTVVLIDDAEELDARRSMQDMNVKFSWWWMIMRLKQVITILTLPSPAAIDSRLEELADVWINVQRRGDALCHDIGVQSYGNRNVTTKKVHTLHYPDVSTRDELVKLQEMKEEKMGDWEREVQGDVESDELGKTQQTFLAIAVKEREDIPWRKVADADDRLTYSGEFYRQQAQELLG